MLCWACIHFLTVTFNRLFNSQWQCSREVMGSCSSLGNISEIYFLKSIQSPTQSDLKWSMWHFGSLLWPEMSAVITGKKLPYYSYNTYQTKQPCVPGNCVATMCIVIYVFQVIVLLTCVLFVVCYSQYPELISLHRQAPHYKMTYLWWHNVKLQAN